MSVYSALREANMSEEQAKVLAAYLDLDLVTKEDLATVATELTAALEKTRQEMTVELAATRQESADGLAAMRQEMTVELAATRQEMTVELAAMRQEMTVELAAMRQESAAALEKTHQALGKISGRQTGVYWLIGALFIVLSILQGMPFLITLFQP